MSDQYGEFINVDSLYYALVSTDTSDAYTAGTPAYLAPVATISGAPTVNPKTTYYDGKPRYTYTTEGTTEITITIANLPAILMATLTGKYYDAASGRVMDSGKTDPPDIAIGFRYEMGTGEYRYYWYLKGTFTGGTEEATTRTDDVDEKTYELTYTAIVTTYEWTVNGETTGQKRQFGDTTDDAFDPTGWFLQVQTPDTTSAPSAIALSSIVPADDATGVLITSTIVLTFNNKIASGYVTVASAAGVIVANTQAYNTAGKILTITPTSSLSAGTTYVVTVAGITDVYGQVLTTTVKNFTTAS